MPYSPQSASQFKRYYEEHKRAVFNYILYRVGFNRETTEDLTSEIFLKAFEHFDSYDKKRSFKTWVFAIAHNHLVNFFGGKKECLPLSDALKDEKGQKLPEAFDQKVTMAKIMRIVMKLPDSAKDLVIMRYVNDLSNKEIAEIIKKEEGAIRTALSRAVAMIREQYNNQFITPKQ